jgi:hypothetical protein
MLYVYYMEMINKERQMAHGNTGNCRQAVKLKRDDRRGGLYAVNN